MNLVKAKVKISVYNVIEILLGLLILVSVILNMFDFIFFISIFGPFGLTFMLLGTMLLAVGAIRLRSVFFDEFSSLTKKINATTSVLTLLAAVVILFFVMIATGDLWLRSLFGIGLLSYGIGRIAVGTLASKFNFGLRTLIALFGLTIAFFSIIVLSFPMVQVHPNVYVTYGYFVDVAFLLIWF